MSRGASTPGALSAHRLTLTMRRCKERSEGRRFVYKASSATHHYARLGRCLPVGRNALQERVKRWRENGEQKKWREVEERWNRAALSCRVMTAEMRDALSVERSRNPMGERREKKEKKQSPFIPTLWDRASSVSCNRVERYPCYCVRRHDLVLSLAALSLPFYLIETRKFILLLLRRRFRRLNKLCQF